MKPKMPFLLLWSALMISQGACGASPLLNHRNPVRNQALTGPSEDETAGCALRFNTLRMCANLEWVRLPNEDENGVFLLRFFKEQAGGMVPSDPPAPLKVAVKLWMPGMGHGSSPVTVVRPMTAAGVPETGVYRVEAVHFVMPGAWEIRVLLKDESGAPVDQAILPYQALE